MEDHLQNIQSSSLIEDIFNDGAILEGIILSTNSGGFIVDIGWMSCFMPTSLASNRFIRDREKLVGRRMQFIVKEIKSDGSVILSHKDVAEAKKNYFDNIKINEIRNAEIKSIKPYGMFITIGGFVGGLVHKNHFDHRIEYSEGETINVIILGKDEEHHRVEAGIKLINALNYSDYDELNVGDCIDVTVQKQFKKGILVSYKRLINFIAINELAVFGNLREEPLPKPGDRIQVLVTSKDEPKKEVSFSISQMIKNRVFDVTQKYSPNQDFESKVLSFDRKRVYIDVNGLPGIIEKKDLFLGYGEISKEVHVGQIIKVRFLKVEDGIAFYSSAILQKDVYDERFYQMGTEELLAEMQIKSNMFYGLLVRATTAEGENLFFRNICVASDSDDEGTLLCDPITGKPISVYVPVKYRNILLDDGYYVFSLCVGSRKSRKDKNSPFYFTIDSSKEKPKHVENPYEKLVNNTFKKQTSPSSNASLASLLNEVGLNMYKSKERMFFELLQNADDASAEEGVKIALELTDRYLIFCHNGMPFNRKDFISITRAAQSSKSRSNKKTGYKGIGFKSVFSNSNLVKLRTGGFLFKFDKDYPLYRKFEDFYFTVNDISEEWQKKDYLERNKDEMAEFNNAESIPWQLLPIWDESIPGDLQHTIFSRKENVSIALKMRESVIDEYLEAINYVLQEPKFMLFLRNTNRIQLKAKNQIYYISRTRNANIIDLQSTLEGGGIKHFCVNNSMISVSDENFRDCNVDIIRREIINLKSGEKEWVFVDKNDGRIPSIPPRIASADYTQISYAVELDEEGQYIPLSLPSTLFAFLPMNEIRYPFPIFINADFILTSNREGANPDNPWNYYLFYQIGRSYCKWIARLASSEQFSYLGLLVKDFFDENQIDMKYLSHYFNEGYRKSIEEEKYIINDRGDLVGQEEIMIDDSGISSIIGSDNFCNLIEDEDRRLTNLRLDISVLYSPIFTKIKHYSWEDVEQRLLESERKKYIRNWFENATEEQIRLIYSFLKGKQNSSNLTKELLLELPIISFNGRFRAYDEIINNPYYILINNTYVQIKETLIKMGFCCSDDNISSEDSLISVDNYHDKRICLRILSAKKHQYDKLSVTERVGLFKCIYPIALRYQKSSTDLLQLSQWRIFKSSDGNYQEVSSLNLETEKGLFNKLYPEHVIEHDAVKELSDSQYADLFLSKSNLYTKCIIGKWESLIQKFCNVSSNPDNNINQIDIYSFVKELYDASNSRKQISSEDCAYILTAEGFKKKNDVFFNSEIKNEKNTTAIEKVVSKVVPAIDCVDYLKDTPFKTKESFISDEKFSNVDLTVTEIKSVIEFAKKTKEDLLSLCIIEKGENGFHLRKKKKDEWLFFDDDPLLIDIVLEYLDGAVSLPTPFEEYRNEKAIISGEKLFKKLCSKMKTTNLSTILLPIIKKQSQNIKLLYINSLDELILNTSSFEDKTTIEIFKLMESLPQDAGYFESLRKRVTIESSQREKYLKDIQINGSVAIGNATFILSSLLPEKENEFSDTTTQIMRAMKNHGFTEDFINNLFDISSSVDPSEVFKSIEKEKEINNAEQLAFVLLYPRYYDKGLKLLPQSSVYKSNVVITKKDGLKSGLNKERLFIMSYPFLDDKYVLSELYDGFESYIDFSQNPGKEYSFSLIPSFELKHVDRIKSVLTDNEKVELLNTLFNTVDLKNKRVDNATKKTLCDAFDVDREVQILSEQYILETEILPSLILNWSGDDENKKNFISIVFGVDNEDSDFMRIRKALGKGNLSQDIADIESLSKKNQIRVSNWIEHIGDQLSHASYLLIHDLCAKISKQEICFDTIAERVSIEPYKKIGRFTAYGYPGKLPQKVFFSNNKFIYYTFSDGNICSKGNKIYFNYNEVENFEKLLWLLIQDEGSTFKESDFLLFQRKQNDHYSKEAETDARERVVEKDNVDVKLRAEINKTARYAAKEYLDERGFDTSLWDPEETIPIIKDKIKKDGKFITVVVTSSRAKKLYLYPWAFAELMQDPDNLLLNYDSKEMIHALSYKDIFEDNQSVNLIFDTDIVRPEILAALANKFRGSKNTCFVIENPRYSVSDELKGFGLNQKITDASINTDFSLDDIFIY